MKTRFFQIIRALQLLALMLAFVAVNAQTQPQTQTKPEAKPQPQAKPAQESQTKAQPQQQAKPGAGQTTQQTPPVKDNGRIKFIITNLVSVSDKVIEFDLYLKDAGTEKPFELSIIQMGILVNTEITNGGDVGSMIVTNFSELNAPQQPSTTLFVKGKGNSIIKVAAKVSPGPGNGTIIKTTGKGTKVCRIRLTNTMPFAKVKPNIHFCFEKMPYPTKVYHYIGQVSVQTPTNATNCVSELTNAMLNQ